MKTISQCLMWILICIISFIWVVLVIWVFKFGWVTEYVKVLNSKNWIDEDISLNPISWIDTLLNKNDVEKLPEIDLPMEEIDNIEIYVDGEKYEEEPGFVDEITNENEETDQEDSINPYDPDFDQEFNDYFS